MVNDFFSDQRNEKEQICERLEVEVVLLKEELEQLNSNFNKGIESLGHILSMQRSPLIKTNLGYREGEAPNLNGPPSSSNEIHPKNIDYTFIASSRSSLEHPNKVVHQAKNFHFIDIQGNFEKEHNARNKNEEKGSIRRNVGNKMHMVHHQSSTKNN